MSPEGKTPDRRTKSPRAIVVRKLKVGCGPDVFFGYAGNVSRSGLFIHSPMKHEQGEKIEIEFKLPGGEKEYRCTAEVVWSRTFKHSSPYPPGFGLKFLDISEADAAEIDGWVAAEVARLAAEEEG